MVEMKSGPLRCEIVPELGASIAGLWLGEHPVLRSTPASELQSSRKAGSYPLVPFSNRIGQASLAWEGTLYPLVRNNGDEPHAIHGVGWQRPWQLLEHEGNHALMSYVHKPDDNWPFAFECSQAVRLTDHGLELTLSVTSHSDKPAPAGLGWHPYFMKRERSRIAFEATGRWEMGADKLPTVRKPAHGLDTDCRFLDVDHCWDGWDGVAHLRDEVMHVCVRSNLRRLVVFTNDTRDYIAIEPVSHVNNAANLAETGAKAQELGLVVLAQGESLMAQMTIEASAVR